MIREERVFSQNGEDGVLASLLDMIGRPTRGVAVEIGAGATGEECCTRHLAELGWDVYRFDQRGDGGGVYREHFEPGTFDAILRRWCVPDPIDVLAIDVDGDDYWLWKATRRTPRIVCIEVNTTYGAHALITPKQGLAWDGSARFGASIQAMTHLAQSKGYQLVHVEASGANAFYVRRDEWAAALWRPLAHRLPVEG